MTDDHRARECRRPDRPRRSSWPRSARPASTPTSDLDRRPGLEARYRGIIDRLPAVIYIDGVGEDDTMVDVEPRHRDLLGMTREEWLATPRLASTSMHPDDRDRVVAASERTVETGEPFRTSTERSIATGARSGSARKRSASDDETATRVLARPDARRHRRSSARERSSTRPHEVRGAGRADPGDRLHRHRRRAHDHDVREPTDRGAARRSRPQEYIDDPELWARMLHPDDRDATIETYLRGRRSGEPFTFEYRLIGRDGRVVWFRDSRDRAATTPRARRRSSRA